MLAVKCTVFIAVALICVGTVNNILIPKNYFNQNWPTTNTYTDFYKLEKNTVDVLLFGSSHAASSLNPQVIYDTYLFAVIICLASNRVRSSHTSG